MKCLSSLAAVLSGLTLMVSTLAPSAAQSISADEAQAIATEAYVYFYPLVTMDLTRKQLNEFRFEDRRYRRSSQHFR